MHGMIAEQQVLDEVQKELDAGGDPFGDSERIVKRPDDPPVPDDIEPLAVGRVVHFFPQESDLDVDHWRPMGFSRRGITLIGVADLAGTEKKHIACAAIVVHACGSKRAHLTVIDHIGKSHYVRNVAVIYPNMPDPADERYCRIS